MSDLKPCPFCGKEPNQATAELGDRPCFYYECENPKCHAAEMGWHDTEQEARDAWNNRPIEDALQARIAELERKKEQLLEIDHQRVQYVRKLEKAAVVWHNYPEEKPDKTGYCIIYYTILNRVAFDFWHNDKQEWDKYGEYILAWAYLPIGKNYLKEQEEE